MFSLRATRLHPVTVERCLRSRRVQASFISSTSHKRRPSTKKIPDKINYNPAVSFEDKPDAEHLNFRKVTANDLESLTSPPTEVKMLVRDFIEDSLYNPNYGYFPKQATIFTSKEQMDFGAMRNMDEFQEEVARRYAAYGLDKDGPGRQIWHTPTELFQPWYGQTIAKCLLSEYLLKYFPYGDLVIYEIGAGNGTLAQDILDYIRDEYPDAYDRTRYNIIEISGNLAEMQREKLCAEHPCVTVTHQSVFSWKTVEPSPCYFLAMEVIDNFAHDMIRYDMKTLEPYQGLVTIDSNGDFATYFSRVTDPLISSFLALRRRLSHAPPIPRLLKDYPSLRSIYTNLPLAPNLSKPEYIPTRLLSLLQTLRKYFPRHRLILSDFSSLPDTIPGICSPVVQTRYQNTTVACSTLFVKQGYFDIFFPTNFERLRDMYEHLLSQPSSPVQGVESIPIRHSPLESNMSPLALGENFFSSFHPKNRRAPLDGVTSSSGLPVGEKKSSVYTHAEFMETYADLERTRLRNGENPILDYYKNVKFLF